MPKLSSNKNGSGRKFLNRNPFGQRPLLTLPQILVLLVVVAALFIALDLNRRARDGELVGVGEETLQRQVDLESTRSVELQATLDYVESDAYVEAYAHGEGGLLLPGEKRVVPLVVETTPQATAMPQPTPDAALAARSWQAWWQLLTDAPLPTP